MTIPTSLYPLSTPKGDAIPNDIFNPTDSYIMPFTTSALGAAAALYGATDNVRLVHVLATEDCLLGFTNTPVSAPANDVLIPSSFFMLRNVLYHIALPSIYLSAIGLTSSGTLYINKINPWNALQLQVQLGLL